MTQRVERLPALSQADVEGLLELFSSIRLYKAEGYTRRQGANATSNLSQYSTNKMDMMPIATRRQFRQFMPKEFVEKALTEYFLHLEPFHGCLDRMVYWLDKYTSMRMYSYALNDNQSIQIDDEVGQFVLDESNIEKYWGHTVWINGKNAILSKDNAQEWLGVNANVRTPVKTHTLRKGEGISFVVNNVHQINRSGQEQIWACIGAAPFL